MTLTVEHLSGDRWRVPTPGGSTIVASRGEVARWALQHGGDGYFWGDVLTAIERAER